LIPKVKTSMGNSTPQPNVNDDGLKKIRDNNVKRIKENTVRINILLLGPPGQGKSSVCNSFYRILTDDSIVLPCETAESKKGTQFYRSVPKLDDFSKIYMFDCPGITLEVEKEDDLVKKLLNGVREDYIQIDWKKTIKEKETDINNKIDYVIFVLSAPLLEEKHTGFIKDEYSVTCKEEFFPNSVINMIREITGHDPFVLITHAKYMKFTKENYRRCIGTSVPDSEIQCVENYITTGGPDNVQMDIKFTEVLVRIIERVVHLKKRVEEYSKKIEIGNEVKKKEEENQKKIETGNEVKKKRKKIRRKLRQEMVRGKNPQN